MARSLNFPLRLNSSGALATNEQDSDADVASGLLLALTWPQGTKRRAADYGRPMIEFTDVDTAALARAAEHSEPRARTRADLIAQAIGTSTVDVGYEQT